MIGDDIGAAATAAAHGVDDHPADRGGGERAP